MKQLLSATASAISLLAFAATASAQTIYQDNFDRTGDLNGSTLTTSASGATWSTSLPTIYSTSTTGGGEVSISPSAYTYQGAYLPVNVTGASLGAGLDNFTLSATLTPGSEGTSAGIALLDAPLGNYDGYNTDALGYITDSGFTLINGNYDFGAGLSGPALLSISYNASAGTLAYAANGHVLETDMGITASEISAITDVSFGFGGNSTPQTATAENFQLLVSGAAPSGGGAPSAAPEPSTDWLFSLALLGLAFQVYRKRSTKA
jgi:hypothetical protein